jgi:hypothetical protein
VATDALPYLKYLLHAVLIQGCGDGRAAIPEIPVACGPDTGQVLTATSLPGSGGFPIGNLSRH